jgi:signal recognition particle subunit SRP19
MDVAGFITIYPSYLDSTKSIREGRRISSLQAVDTPTVSDISQALQSLGIRHVLQPHKGYSRDTTLLWENPGRVKVQPSDEYPTKRRLLVEIAARIVDLPSRKQRLEQAQIAAAEEEKAIEAARAVKQKNGSKKQQSSASSNSKPSTTGAGGGSSKKKGKKKR